MIWQSRLIHWYRRHRRDLPWRRTRDPYAIWVSEIMLQQTTVEAVIPYYERFLKRFPDVSSLARADEAEVLQYWSGLGYYARARNLRDAAKKTVDFGSLSAGPASRHPFELRLKRRSQRDDRPSPAHYGENRRSSQFHWPRTAAEWRCLPGIGRYTAGAIASIAFGERVSVLDGNVIRVLSRLFAISADPKSSRGQKIFWDKAEDILPVKNCGDFNQGLMELGATVCLPESPRCPECPIAIFCSARQEGRPEFYPRGRKKVSYCSVILSAAVIRKNGKLLMVRRPDRGLLRGMWEFPMVEGNAAALARAFSLTPRTALGLIRHSVLNRRLLITPYLCRPKGRPLSVATWFSPKAIRSLPTSSMNRKILHLISPSLL